jgi:hypothetical protein
MKIYLDFTLYHDMRSLVYHSKFVYTDFREYLTVLTLILSELNSGSYHSSAFIKTFVQHRAI